MKACQLVDSFHSDFVLILDKAQKEMSLWPNEELRTVIHICDEQALKDPASKQISSRLLSTAAQAMLDVRQGT